MNSLRLPVRRAAAVAAGLALGLGGALIATAAAHAEEITPNEAGKGVVNCSTQTISPDREGEDGLHPWRIVFRSADGEQVMWQSGDWEPDADLGDDLAALVEQGWAVNDFTATLEIEGIPNGTFQIQWWADAVSTPSWKTYPRWDNDTLNGQKYDPWNRKYGDDGKPCSKIGMIEVTQPTCENPVGTVVIPEPVDKHEDVTWTINGEAVEPGTHELEPGTYEITALRIGDVKNYTKTWTVEIEPVDCPTPSPTPEPPGEGGGLPETGTATTLFAGGAAGLVALGGVLYLAARRRRVTFTA